MRYQFLDLMISFVIGCSWVCFSWRFVNWFTASKFPVHHGLFPAKNSWNWYLPWFKLAFGNNPTRILHVSTIAIARRRSIMPLATLQLAICAALYWVIPEMLESRDSSSNKPKFEYIDLNPGSRPHTTSTGPKLEMGIFKNLIYLFSSLWFIQDSTSELVHVSHNPKQDPHHKDLSH